MELTARSITQLERIARTALDALGEQPVLSQGRCVDLLLDLYCATNDVGLRWSIVDRLSEIGQVAAVAADDIRADLEAILAIAEPGSAFRLRCVESVVDEEFGSRAA